MRKLRRLPWRIPKSHNQQPAQHSAQSMPMQMQQQQMHAAAEPCPRMMEPERKSYREEVNTQPVAFAGGRYVYGDAPSVSCSTEIRRKTRHRLVLVGA